MFCPYRCVDHDETTPFSDEHIIPYAMGGADVFAIPVCEFSNNRLGGQVDRPIIEYDTVRSEKFFLGLEGTDGTKPTLNLSGTSYLHGNEVDLRFVVGPNGKEMKMYPLYVPLTHRNQSHPVSVVSNGRDYDISKERLQHLLLQS
jgi:hypothetical protein